MASTVCIAKSVDKLPKLIVEALHVLGECESATSQEPQSNDEVPVGGWVKICDFICLQDQSFGPIWFGQEVLFRNMELRWATLQLRHLGLPAGLACFQSLHAQIILSPTSFN